MKNINQIVDLIENGIENDCLDFKKHHYKKENFSNLLLDIMSMANSESLEERYILVGIKDYQDGTREVIGVEPSELIDSSVYQNLVYENIEPYINFDIFYFEYKNKLIGVFKIFSSNNDRPYMLKKKYDRLNEGTCKIRRGSFNSLVTRKDIDRFYQSREKFEIKLMESYIAATDESIGCARTSVSIRNFTRFPVVVNYGLLTIYRSSGEELTMHRVYGFGRKEDIIGADFQLTIYPMDEKLGDLFVSFSSSDCIKLGLDEYGCSDEDYLFELLFIDTNNNKYKTVIDDGKVLAKGKYLWKVELAARKFSE
ncbi:MAG: ATP-binding protein [Bacillales bacterium]|jgi:hypothetical protein|nr:ATP-binding protein [Bacillales bacterium]